MRTGDDRRRSVGASFIERISQAPGVRVVVPASDVMLGGLSATQLDLETVAVADCPDASVAWVVPFFEYFFLGPEERARLIAVDVGDQTVVIAVEAPSAKWESYIGHAEAVIDSLTIGQDAEPSDALASSAPGASPVDGVAQRGDESRAGRGLAVGPLACARSDCYPGTTAGCTGSIGAGPSSSGSPR